LHFEEQGEFSFLGVFNTTYWFLWVLFLLSIILFIESFLARIAKFFMKTDLISVHIMM